MSAYTDLIHRQEMELNSLPIQFPSFDFGETSLAGAMARLGLTVNDVSKIERIPNGGIMRREDVHLYHEMMHRHRQELRDAISADETGEGFIRDMFRSRINLTEYSITGDLEAVVYASGYSLKDVLASYNLTNGLRLALEDFDKCLQDGGCA